MEDLMAVVYTSVAARSLSTRDLDALLINARAFNENVSVTGALIHSEFAFLQYFEGPTEAVARVYERIKRSGSHKNLVERLNQPIATRQFENWHMAFAQAPSSVLEELSNEYWEMTLPGLQSSQYHSPGLTLLLDFWRSARDGRTDT
jgi:Sensors of blue-light using FAD